MSTTTIGEIQLRRGTAATWVSTNPVLASGEAGYETDTGKLKIGTGSAAWTSLPYATDVFGGVTPPGGWSDAGIGVRRAHFGISTCDGGSFNPAGSGDWCQRTLARIPVSATRWRFRLRNILKDGTVTTGTVNISGIWVGLPNYDSTGAWDGTAVSLTQVLTSFTTDSAGGESVSSWITSWLPPPGQTFVISMGVTAGTATAWQTGICACWSHGSTGIAANAGVPNLAGLTPAADVFFDMRFDYEFNGNTPIGLVLGDSLSDATDPDVIENYATKRWYEIASRRLGYPIAGNAAGGFSSSDFVSPASWIWRRFAASGLTIDFAVVALMGNDIIALHALVTYQANIATIVGNLRAAGINRIYLEKDLPCALFQHAHLTATAAIGATTFAIDSSQPYYTQNPLTTSDVIRVGQGTDAETFTPSAVTTNSITVPASTKKHYAGDLVAGNTERLRTTMNEWTATLPYDIDGVLDWDTRIRWSTDPSLPEHGLTTTSDWTHLRIEGYARMAEALIAALAVGGAPGVTPPANIVLPAITGTPRQGEVLTCSRGTWTGTQTITYAYQWQTDATGSFANIPGATASTYTCVSGDVGHHLRCVVTATNLIGSATANSASVGPIGAAVSFVSVVNTYTSGTGAFGPITVASGDLIAVFMAWTSGGTAPAITDSQGNTYALQHSEPVSNSTFQTTIGYAFASASGSVTVTISNHASLPSVGSTVVANWRGVSTFDTGNGTIDHTGSATTITTPLTLAAANEVVLASTWFASGTPTLPGGWVLVEASGPGSATGGGQPGVFFFYSLAQGPGAITVSSTSSAAGNVDQVAAAFR